jgi:hypothetical protein
MFKEYKSNNKKLIKKLIPEKIQLQPWPELHSLCFFQKNPLQLLNFWNTDNNNNIKDTNSFGTLLCKENLGTVTQVEGKCTKVDLMALSSFGVLFFLK